MIFAPDESCGEWAAARWLCVLERGFAAYLVSQGTWGWAKKQGSGRTDQGGEAWINATPAGHRRRPRAGFRKEQLRFEKICLCTSGVSWRQMLANAAKWSYMDQT